MSTRLSRTALGGACVFVLVLVMIGGPPTIADETDLILGDVAAVSEMGPADRAESRAHLVTITEDPTRGRHLAVWTGAENPNEATDVDVFARVLEPDGTDQLRVSDIGGDGPTFTSAIAAVYNATNGEYLIAWAGASGAVNPEFDIWVRRMSAIAGAFRGPAVQISTMADPIPIVGLDVAYNQTSDEYLVVWAGRDDDPLPPLERFEDEVFGQRLSSDAEEVGPDDFRISRIQGDGDTGQVAVQHVSVTHNPVAGEYLVVWDGLAYLGTEIVATGVELDQVFVDTEYEIFGSFVSDLGLAGDDFLISDEELPGPPAEPLPEQALFDDIPSLLPDRSNARDPRVEFNEVSSDYLVVWVENGGENGLGSGEFEVFGKVLTGTNNRERVETKFRVSDHGPNDDRAFGVDAVELAVDRERGEHLVTWTASDPDAETAIDIMGPSFLNSSEVFGQLVSLTGQLVGDARQLTEVGPPRDATFDVVASSVAPAGVGGYVVAYVANSPDLTAEPAANGTIFDTEVFTRGVSLDLPPPAPVTTVESNEPPPTSAAPTPVATVGTPPPMGSATNAIGLIVAFGLAGLLAAAGAWLVVRRNRSPDTRP